MKIQVGRAVCGVGRTGGAAGVSLSYRACQVATVLLILGALFGAVTLIALEGQEVVVVRTIDAGGQVHDTRTWIAQDAEGIWIEAATPARSFAQHVMRTGQVEIVRGRTVRHYAASIAPNPAGHERIRALLAQKYGWADWWIGLLQDTSTSVAVRCMKTSDQS